ncbi:MAG: HAD family hydrolase [Thermoguttaceae bacterium]|nr:HAD family hydrolase [Thermoguttaceae bacterium]
MSEEFTPKSDFFIGIDSDGCAFDTMELKQKECFIPTIIKHWGWQSVSKYAREVIEFVNLYSKTRGINRFPALIDDFKWLARRPEVIARGLKVEPPQEIIDWMNRETKLGNAALAAEVERTGDPVLKKTLAWSLEVNEVIDAIVGEGVAPFPLVRESLEKAGKKADIMVVSATPQAALVKEWENQGLLPYVSTIAGQEIGTKKESLRWAARYPKDHALMIGDAPGDYKASVANSVLFFPINPGEEEKSWEAFLGEGLDRFFAGTFAGEYQQKLLDEFDRHLPELPPWKTV